jgi:hypothetical protein
MSPIYRLNHYTAHKSKECIQTPQHKTKILKVEKHRADSVAIEQSLVLHHSGMFIQLRLN